MSTPEAQQKFWRDHPKAVDHMKPGDIVYDVADEHGRQILTVGTLREMLDGVDDDRHVLIATKDSYDNIKTVIVPTNWETAEFSAVTIFPGDEYDSRQF